MSREAVEAAEFIKSLERQCDAAHKLVDTALNSARKILIGAIVLRNGRAYQITDLRAYRGVVGACAVRFEKGRPLCRELDIGDFRLCKVLEYPKIEGTPSVNPPRNATHFKQERKAACDTLTEPTKPSPSSPS